MIAIEQKGKKKWDTFLIKTENHMLMIYKQRQREATMVMRTVCITESIMDVVVERVPVAVVGEAIVVGGELLQALRGDGGEVAGDLGVVR